MPRIGSTRLDRRVEGGRTAKDYSIIVAYDGERTEDDYFRGWKLVIPPSRLSLEHIHIRSGGNALDAVRAAIKKKRASRNFSEFWCVCDVDDTQSPHLEEAVRLAATNDIRLCLSDRCFEIWIALHYAYTDKELATERDAIDLVRQFYSDYGAPYKTVPFHILHEKTQTAISNAAKLEKDGSGNPITKVHHLVRKLKQNCV